MHAVLHLTPLEVASHVVVGAGENRPGPPAAVGNCDPLSALEDAIRPALLNAPCLVSFSGGHDSSLVLGLAVRIARRDGLPLPVPITCRFTDAPLAEESELQETVVRALELTEWTRVAAGDDLDFVGPVSTGVLERHGLLYPANTFLHAPLFDHATGGTLLTGYGGDHVLARCSRARRPLWMAERSDPLETFPWLRRHPAADVERALARERHSVPSRVDRRGRWRAGRRDVALACSSLAAVAEGRGTRVEHPLLDPGFLSALEHSGICPHSAGGRARLITAIVGDVLPEACTTARPKARFREVMWRRHTRALLSRHHLDSIIDAIDDGIIDPDGLRREWGRERPNARTALLLQKAWLTIRCTAGDSAGPEDTGRTDKPGRGSHA